MTKAKRKSTKKIKMMRRKYIMRRIFILLPIIILVSIPLFKLLNLFILRAEYCEALFSNNRVLADMIYAERLSKAGFLYNLPKFFKIVLGLVLGFIWCSGLYVLVSPIEKKTKKKIKRAK